MDILLTLESFRPNIAFHNEKIITIGVMEITNNKNRSTFILTEWDSGGEKELVSKFYEYLKARINQISASNLKFFTGEKDALERIFVYGFNILRFDIPILIQKGVEYSIGNLPDLNLMWGGLIVTDYLQLMLPYNKMKYKGLTWNGFVEILRRLGYKVPKIKTEGNEIKQLYLKGDYDSIVNRVDTKLKILYVATSSKLFGKKI
ncbi:hypothetical protein V6M85_02195 [Sulfolobus tengchongensis]|uniref:Uncharacterized protein n=1 Tax=Sulfolobus tengchongensis TaxID=207809 RepID=A0AAX4L2S0_9CREN